jgi:hypothetical protein
MTRRALMVNLLALIPGLIGVQMFSGMMDRRCATLDNPMDG